MSALLQELDDNFSVREQSFDGSVDYVRTLVEGYRGTVELFTGAGRIARDVYPLLPQIAGFELSRKNISDRIAACIFPYAQSLLAGGVHLKITISDNPADLAPPTVVGEGETFVAFDTNGTMRCIFLPPYHALTDAAVVNISSGIVVEGMPARIGEHRLGDDRRRGPAGATSNFPIKEPENRFQDPIEGYEGDTPPPKVVLSLDSPKPPPEISGGGGEPSKPHAPSPEEIMTAVASLAEITEHPVEAHSEAHPRVHAQPHVAIHEPVAHEVPHPAGRHTEPHVTHESHPAVHSPEAHIAHSIEAHVIEAHAAPHPASHTEPYLAHELHAAAHAPETHRVPHAAELHAVFHPAGTHAELHAAPELQEVAHGAAPHRVAHTAELHAEPHPVTHAELHAEHELRTEAHAEEPHATVEHRAEAHGPEEHVEPHPTEAHTTQAHGPETHAEPHAANEAHADAHGPETHAEPHATHEVHAEEPHPAYEQHAEVHEPEAHSPEAHTEPHPTETHAEELHAEPAHTQTLEAHHQPANEMEQRTIKLAEREEFDHQPAMMATAEPTHEPRVVLAHDEKAMPVFREANLQETINSPAYQQLVHNVPTHHHVYDQLQPPKEAAELHAQPAPDIKPPAAPKSETVIKVAAMPSPKQQRLSRAEYMKRLHLPGMMLMPGLPTEEEV